MLEICLPVLDESSLDAVREVFGSDLEAICVSGADPATLPRKARAPRRRWVAPPSLTRLPEDALQRSHVAINQTEYDSLWASLALTGQPPTVDFIEIVLHFGAVYSGSCPETRLDAVQFDAERSVVHPVIVQLGAARASHLRREPARVRRGSPGDRLPAAVPSRSRRSPIVASARTPW